MHRPSSQSNKVNTKINMSDYDNEDRSGVGGYGDAQQNQQLESGNVYILIFHYPFF